MEKEETRWEQITTVDNNGLVICIEWVPVKVPVEKN